ncbi:MAG: hypothetical protein ACRCYU_13540 [Nocardioides sp.]
MVEIPNYPPPRVPPPSTAPDPELTWWWGLADPAGTSVQVDSAYHKRFPNQADAESWVGEFWRDLVAMGVDSVRLMDGEREVYGPMSLRP